MDRSADVPGTRSSGERRWLVPAYFAGTGNWFQYQRI